MAVCLIIVFLTVQFRFALAACKLCSESDEMILHAGFARPNPQEIEFLYNELDLNEGSDSINLDESYKIDYGIAKLFYIASDDGTINLILEKEDSAILLKSTQSISRCDLFCLFSYGDPAWEALIACPALFLIKSLFPSEKELIFNLYVSCSNGIFGLMYLSMCLLNCHEL